MRQSGSTKIVTITSTYDHRVIQGAESGMFLRKLDSLLQGEDGFYDRVFESLGLPGSGMRDAGSVTTAPSPAPTASRIQLREVAMGGVVELTRVYAYSAL